MIRRLLFVHLCLFVVAAVDVCPNNPPPANKSMPANTSGGQLHITQTTSPAKYQPPYVLEVTDFDLDTPIKSFAQYAGPAIGSKELCQAHSVMHRHWYFDQETGCWGNGPNSGKAGVWNPNTHTCDLSYEENISTKKGDGTPTHYTKIRVEAAAYHNVLVKGQLVHMRKPVKLGVISF